jgi:hypothetical protein
LAPVGNGEPELVKTDRRTRPTGKCRRALLTAAIAAGPGAGTDRRPDSPPFPTRAKKSSCQQQVDAMPIKIDFA